MEPTKEQALALAAVVIDGGPSRTVTQGILGYARVPFSEDLRRLVDGEKLSDEKRERLAGLARLFAAAADAIDEQL